MVLESRMGPFWPPKMTNDAKATAARAFQDHIYPLWREPWSRYDASAHLVPGNAGYVSEIETIHLCDRLILADDFVLTDAAGSLARSDEFEKLKSQDRMKIAAGEDA